MKSFASWYNGEHQHSAIRFVTPNARHTGHDRATLANRTILYANARAQNPERWSGKTRNWKPAGPVWLNPQNEISASEIDRGPLIGVADRKDHRDVRRGPA